MDRKGKFMSGEVFGVVLRDYVLPYKDKNRFCPPTIIMHKDGESTLHKEYNQFVKMVSDADPALKIDIYTHGLTLPKKPGFLEFLGSLPSQMRMLMSFHFFNGDGSANDYTATNTLVRNYLDEGRWPRNVELILTSHLVRPMTAERLAEWKSTWQQYIDSRQISAVHANVSLNPWAGRINEPGTVKFNGCPYGDFGHMFFGVTGNVIACCLDLEEEIVFGNVLRDDPAEMVAKLDEFYADQRAGKVKYPVCANCFGQERRDVVQLGTEKVSA